MHCAVASLAMILFVGQLSGPGKYDREHNGVIGQVRSIRQEWSFISREGDKLVEGKRALRESTTYDHEGRLIQQTSYIDGKVISKAVYTYDAEGGRTKILQDKPLPVPDRNQSDSTRSVADPIRTRQFREVFKYDSNGDRTEETLFGPDGKVASRTAFKYDPERKTVEITEYHQNDAIKSRCVETLGEKRERVSRVCYDASSAPTTRQTWIYDFDAHGNWTRSLSTVRGSGITPETESKLVVYRTITYFSANTSGAADVPDVSTDEWWVPKVPSDPIRMSGGVLQGKVTKKVAPMYPYVARAAGVSGAVVVEVTVDEKGNVIKAEPVSGPLELQAAAVAAVREWKFARTELSGVPVKVIGRITFNFTL